MAPITFVYGHKSCEMALALTKQAGTQIVTMTVCLLTDKLEGGVNVHSSPPTCLLG